MSEKEKIELLIKIAEASQNITLRERALEIAFDILYPGKKDLVKI